MSDSKHSPSVTLCALLLFLLAVCVQSEANLTLTATEERILLDAYQVIVHNFQFRRHEWSFAAVKYAGFLHFFSTSWRLVTRFGGTYAVDGSSYYNRWNWNEALDTLSGYLEDLERYHRVYRHMAWSPGEGGSARVRAEWHRRYPQHRQDATLFLDFMVQHSGRGALGIPGYLATGEQQAERYRGLQRLTGAAAACPLGSAARQLLTLATRVVQATSAQSEAILYSTLDQQGSSHLAAIVTDYILLSKLAWDRIPSLVANASSDLMCRGGSNISLVNVSDSAAWLGRQVLGHVLLYLRHLELARWQLSKLQAASLTALYCRVAREDVDKELAGHLEAREMAQLEQLLGDCRQTGITRGTTYTELAALWRRLRTRISREYSAFQQYSNRIPAILQAKAAVKFILPPIAVVGVALNTLIVAYYARHARARRVGRNFLITLLSGFDTAILLLSCLVLFTDRYMEHDQELRPNAATDLWCKFQAYLLNLAVEASAFVVVILSVERFLAVYSLFRQPAAEQPHKDLPLRKLSIMALCAFCFACIFNCMLIIGDEVAAPAKSTIGRQCVHYVRLNNFHANLAFVTRVKPALNALVRSCLPYSLVCLLSLATCWLLFRKGAYQSLHRQEQEAGGRPDGQLARSLGQLGLAFAYLLLTAPAPLVYTLFMTAHADRLIIKLTNGLYDEVDPIFRAHWSRIGRLTVAQYVTEYVLVPMSASINFCVFYLTDAGFRRYVMAVMICASRRRTAGAQEELSDSQDQPQRLQQRPGGETDWEQTEIL